MTHELVTGADLTPVLTASLRRERSSAGNAEYEGRLCAITTTMINKCQDVAIDACGTAADVDRGGFCGWADEQGLAFADPPVGTTSPANALNDGLVWCLTCRR